MKSGASSREATAIPVIAIDGPAASGKGTIAAEVARALGFHLLDSGALYRLVALKAQQANVPYDAAATLAEEVPEGVGTQGCDGWNQNGEREVHPALRGQRSGRQQQRRGRDRQASLLK